jgi:F0F1-type ATP synthase assembly protein I
MFEDQDEAHRGAPVAAPDEGWGSASFHREIGRAVTVGNDAAGFFASVAVGLMVGLGADHLLGTGPALVVAGIMAGAGTGLWRIWRYLERGGDEERH